MANKFRLDGVVGVDFDAAYVAGQLQGEGDVEITLNTRGGHIHEGLQIYSAIRDHEGFVTMIAEQAMSMGSIFLLAADKAVGKRQSTVVMIHRPHGGGSGRSEDLRRGAAELDRLQGKMEEIYMSSFKASRDDLVRMLDEETFLDADEAMALGLLHEVIDGGKGSLHRMAFAALAGDVDFDKMKFSAKVSQIENKANDFCAELQNVGKLSDIESAVRKRFGASRSEAAAIVATVKRVHSDYAGSSAADDSAAKALQILNDFKLPQE